MLLATNGFDSNSIPSLKHTHPIGQSNVPFGAEKISRLTCGKIQAY